jgi:hypothetical protein
MVINYISILYSINRRIHDLSSIGRIVPPPKKDIQCLHISKQFNKRISSIILYIIDIKDILCLQYLRYKRHLREKIKKRFSLEIDLNFWSAKLTLQITGIKYVLKLLVLDKIPEKFLRRNFPGKILC